MSVQFEFATINPADIPSVYIWNQSNNPDNSGWNYSHVHGVITIEIINTLEIGKGHCYSLLYNNRLQYHSLPEK